MKLFVALALVLVSSLALAHGKHCGSQAQAPTGGNGNTVFPDAGPGFCIPLFGPCK